MGTTHAPHRRSDGNRNHEAVLRAACRAFSDQGAGASLESVAREAGVGIATVYRHVRSREELQRSVVLVAMRLVADAARRAMEEDDARSALLRYTRSVLDQRVAGVVLALRDVVDVGADEELTLARAESSAAVDDLVHRVRHEGVLRADVTSVDVSMLLARLDRPLPGPLTERETADLTRRQVQLVLGGLAP